jgi:predicted chitinase
VARQLGNTQPGDGPKFCGRGFVQLTGRRNYTDWGTRLNIPLVTNPLLAMQADVAAKILIEGSRLGTFTGKKFADYFNPTKEDWVNARRIINGLDKAHLIASYAKSYYSAISYTV